MCHITEIIERNFRREEEEEGVLMGLGCQESNTAQQKTTPKLINLSLKPYGFLTFFQTFQTKFLEKYILLSLIHLITVVLR